MRISLQLDKQVRKDGSQTVYFNLSHGQAGSSNQIRKKISSKIHVKQSDMDITNFRVLPKNKNQVILNKAIKELKEKRDTALINFESGNWTIKEIVYYLKGKVLFDSVDSYIDTVIKDNKKSATFNDYKNTLKAFKKHLNRKDDVISFNDFANFNNLDKLKTEALKSGLSGNSINSYFKKIRAILNDAYDRGFVQNKFELNKRLRVPVQRKQIQTCNSSDFKKAIKKVQNIYDWQSLAFFLLMFATRGMYPADIVNFKIKNFENSKGESDILDFFCENDYDYLIHRRSKTSNRANEDMIIRIDSHPTMTLIAKLKDSVIYTHYNRKPEIIPRYDEYLSIFNYDVDNDYSMHSNIWNVYEKRIKKLLGYSFNKGRKTFNTYALELKVSDSIRKILLGHADESMLIHYNNNQTIEIRKQVEEAHINVLDKFETTLLTELLIEKLDELNIPDWLTNGTIYTSEKSKLKMIKSDSNNLL